MIKGEFDNSRIDFDFQTAYYDGVDLDGSPDLSLGGWINDAAIDSKFDDPEAFYAEQWQLEDSEVAEDDAQKDRKFEIERIASLDGEQRSFYAWQNTFRSLGRPNFAGRKEPKSNPALSDDILIGRAQNGDKAARNAVATRHLGLVTKVAVGWSPTQHLDKGDLFQSAIAGPPATSKNEAKTAGLLNAIERFKPHSLKWPAVRL